MASSRTQADIVRFVAAVTVAALAVLALALYRLAPVAGALLGASAVTATALYVAGFVVLNRYSFSLHWRGHSLLISLDEAVVYLGLIFLPAPYLVPLTGVANLIIHALAQRAALKGVFNVGHYMVAAGAAWGGFALGTHLGLAPAVAALASPVLFGVVSNIQVAGVFATLEGGNPLAIYRERLLGADVLGGAIGVGGGVCLYALYLLHPVSLLAIVPFAVLAKRHGALTARADRELEVRAKLSGMARELVGVSDVDQAADRVLEVAGDVILMGRATLEVDLEDGPRKWSRTWDGGPSGKPVQVDVPARGGGRLGELRIYRSRRTAHVFDETDVELMRLVAAAAGSALETARALAALDASRARMQTYLGAAEDAVMLLSLDGGLEYLNPAGQRLFGVDAADVPDCHASNFFQEDFLLNFTRWAQERALVEMDATSLDATRILEVEANCAPLEEGGRMVGVLAVVRDVTERKRMEAEMNEQRELLTKQEKLSVLGTLVASVAHEINNPLTSLRTMVELAQMDVGDLEDVREDPEAFAERVRELEESLNTAFRGIERLQELTASLKSVGKEGTGNLRVEELGDIAHNVIQVLRVGFPRHVRLELQRAPEAVHAEVHPGKLHQVMLNLVKNAAEAIGDAPGRVVVRTRLADGDALLEVEDDGPGIPPEVVENLFKTFYTTKENGTGLGLSISQRIVREHNGTLEVESEVGRGTRFTIRLPVATPASEEFGPLEDAAPEGATSGSERPASDAS